MAALEIQHHAIVLRQITTAHVASRLRVFFEAGWTVHDVLTALDWTPHGTRYPYSGGDYVQNPGAWLTRRLRVWVRDDGTLPLP